MFNNDKDRYYQHSKMANQNVGELVSVVGALGLGASIVTFGGGVACGAVRGKESAYSGPEFTEGTRRSMWASLGAGIASVGVIFLGVVIGAAMGKKT
jgi:hypothetical protein